MKTNVRNNRFIIPPASIAEADARRLVLAGEIARVEAQLSDKDRMKKHASLVLYDRWRISATTACRLFRKEERMLLVWITVAQDELLRKCYDILRSTDERDLEPHELETVHQLDRLYATSSAPTSTMVVDNNKQAV